MTAGEKETHKEKVKKVMIDYLTTLGYPNLSNEQIMSQLKNMWLKIEEAGLVVEDMNFQAFCAYANNAFMIAEVQGIMGI
jgi:hypothetical protein